MATTWFDLNWCWIGAGFACVLLILLFGTKKLQNNKSISRFRDMTWLSWAITAAFMLHNIEEYGIDFMGSTYSFPETMQGILSNVGISAPTPLFFDLVNIPIIWVVGPLVAIISRKHPLMALSLLGTMIINTVIHIVPFIVIGYNPGLVTAIVLYIPLIILSIRAYFGKGKMSVATLVFVILTGVLVHAILVGSIVSSSKGIISMDIACVLQVVNAVLTPLLLYLLERYKGGKLIKNMIYS